MPIILLVHKIAANNVKSKIGRNCIAFSKNRSEIASLGGVGNTAAVDSDRIACG